MGDGYVRGGVIRSLERGLLGVVTESFSRRVRSEGWTPEGLGDACWRCGSSVGAFEIDGDGCASCRGERVVWDRAVRLGGYSDGLIRDAVLELKYAGWRRSGGELGAALGEKIALAARDAGLAPASFVVVPVPMPWTRRVVRGVDHTLVLSRGVAASMGARVERLLVARHHRRQVGLGATQRAANIKGGFRLSGPSERVLGRIGDARGVVLIDDVLTTGSTLGAASRTLLGVLQGVSGGERAALWVGVAGVSGDPGRRDGVLGSAEPAPLGLGGGSGVEIPQEVCPRGLTRRG